MPPPPYPSLSPLHGIHLPQGSKAHGLSPGSKTLVNGSISVCCLDVLLLSLDFKPL